MKSVAALILCLYTSIGIAASLVISEEVILDMDLSPVERAQEWAKCSAVYDVYAYTYSSEMPAMAEKLRGLSRGAGMGAFMSIYLSVANRKGINYQHKQTVLKQAKLALSEWTKVWKNEYLMRFEGDISDAEVERLDAQLISNVSTCLKVTFLQEFASHTHKWCQL